MSKEAPMRVPKDVMMEAMQWFRQIAVVYNNMGDKENCSKNLKIAADLAVELAPYCHKRMSVRGAALKKADRSRPRRRSAP